MSLTVVQFSIGPYRCALPAIDVHEVLRIVALTSCANAPSFLEGVINRRGATTPVIDMRKRAGLAPGPFDSTTHIVITLLGGRHAGLIVDEVEDVVAIDPDGMNVDHDRPIALRHCASQVVKDGDHVVVVIDPAKILSEAEGRELNAAHLV